MKKMMLVAAMAVLPMLADAGIRIDNQLISEGDSVTKLVRYLGQPATRSFVDQWCDRKKKSICTMETWGYYHEGKEWTIKIFQNKITEMEWTRG